MSGSVRRFFGLECARALLIAFALFIGLGWTVRQEVLAADPNQGPGGPILVVTSSTAAFGKYYAEILRGEGLNAFAVADISTVSAASLAQYKVVILAKMSLTATQVTTLSNWVSGGGNLIAMQPDAQLLSLMGLTTAGASLNNAYLLVDTSSRPGNGIVNQAIQFHGSASLYSLNGATSLATLYASSSVATAYPAVTIRSVGSSGGHAVAFAYDLAASIVYMRQGNPLWAAQERDSFAPIRPDDKFYGDSASDPQADWIDLDKVAIPQADMQQRFLANIIYTSSLSNLPLPRFWYFPNGKKAVVVMSGDDHGRGGTVGRFNQFISSSPSGCSVANWECVRGTSYIYPNTPITDAQAAAFDAQGFEVGLHVNTNCEDFTQSTLESFYVQQLNDWTTKYSSVSAPVTQRHHCIVWSDWATGAKVQLNHGMRLDTSYYYWPPGWVLDVPGNFTGSAMPQRFADLDGTLIDVYQVVTQMTDESGQTYPFTIDTLLDRAVGAEEYYGVYTVNAHTDEATSTVADAVVASAQARSVPIVSASQMLTWLDGRNASSFNSLAWSGSALTFSITPGAGANGLQAMVPRRSSSGVLSSITRNGSAVSTTLRTINGVEYATFTGTSGAYVATYAADTTPPTITATSPSSGATGVLPSAAVTATFSEAIDPATVTGSTFELRNAANTLVSAVVTYDAATRTARLKPAASLAGTSTYTVTVRGGSTDPRVKDLAGNALGANAVWTFTTAAADTTPPTVTATSPANGASGVSTAAAVTVTFSEAIDSTTVSVSTVELKDANSALVSSTVTYNAATRTATLTPTTALSMLSTYTVTVRGGSTDPRIKDLSGNALSANVSWSFTTAAPSCPCSIWSSSATPATADFSESLPLEMGVKFRSDVSGYITGIRFYKGAGNTGTHIGTLWSSSGTKLASATFSGETATGWQQVNFSSPVAISANTVYVASYFAPNGHFAVDNNYFAATGVDNGALHALKDGVSGGNGVFAYNSTSTFPSSTFGSSNYWVDVVFTTSVGPDTTPPTVASVTPASGATGISTATTVNVAFSEALDASSVSTSSIELRNAANAVVPATVSYNAGTWTATLTPTTALAASSTYSVLIKGGATDPRVKDLAGNALASNVSSSFTTAAAAGGCPCSIWSASATPVNVAEPESFPVELGVKFTSDVSGYITGIRFYKGSGNSGTHIGNLWTSTGTLLATATFSSESATGWQQVNFASPVQIAAGTVYVASYFAPNGFYAGDTGYFTSTGVDNGVLHALKDGVSGGNGVYVYGSNSAFPSSTYQGSNYWVDVVFATSIGPDTTPPTVVSTTPSSGATGVPVNSAITVKFSEGMDPSTINANTVQLRNAANALVSASVSYDGPTLTATLTPTAVLSTSSTYTLTVVGGASDPRVKDLAGNALAASLSRSFTTAATNPCGANAIAAENCLTGNPKSEWDISGHGDESIQGFATQISVNRGSTISFKVKTNATDYRFDIYRMGYYGGMGARKVATVTPSATLPQTQPACLNNTTTGLIDCGNWGVSGSWAVPATATSGIYFAKVVRNDTQGASHIFFIVRNDASTSNFVFQTSDTTWQAYNDYGGNSLYTGAPGTNPDRAYKVSYNRPFWTRTVDGGQDWVFNAEYPMVRWLESNGYDVSYISGVDADRAGSLLLNHKAFLSVGHDEYWSGTQRSNVEAARAAGVHLAFFSGNEVFWKTRWENSIDSSNTPYRTLVTYKETHAGAKIDPTSTWTGTWRDPRFSPPADGGRPENALTGTLFMVNGDNNSTTSLKVPAADGKMRFWRNTTVANLAEGATATLPFGTLGYEWDIDADNGVRPAGLIRLSTTDDSGLSVLQDYGSTYATGSARHSLTLYKHSNGALVFGAGTVQWSWGLDANHDRGNLAADVRMQQATVNLFADMGIQPATLQAGLVAAQASTDTSAPSSSISSPANGAVITPGSTITISGTASDSGGVVGGVEVSVDGGTTWHPATGRASWTYSWTPSALGSVTIRSRAADDSGNIESPSTGVTVTVGSADTTPPTVTTVTPASGATGVAVSAAVTATFSEAMDASTISTSTVELRDGANALVAAAVSYNASTRVATLTPSSSLTGGATYTATVKGGATDPRVKDTSGNALASNRVWSFTTASSDTTPPAVPTGITATATTTGITVAWAATAAPDLAGYNVYRSSSATGTYTKLNAALLTTTSYDDTLAPSGSSFYVVRAQDTAGNLSAQSTSASASLAKTNRVANPGFEIDANNNGRPDSWTNVSAVTRSSAVVRSGTYAMQQSSTSNATFTLSQVVSGLSAGTSYAFAGWVNIPATSDAFTYRLQVRWRNILNGTIRTDTVKTYSAATGGWDKASATLVAPSGTTNAVLLMVTSSLNATIYVDDFAFR